MTARHVFSKHLVRAARHRKGHTWNLGRRWGVVLPTGDLLQFSVARRRRDAIAEMMRIVAQPGATWRQFYRDGFRARRVALTVTVLA